MIITRRCPRPFPFAALVLAAAALLGGCFFDGKLKHDSTTTPEALGDGWDIDTPENVGLSRATLDGIHRELLREDRYIGTLGFLVIKDGKLVYETYLRRLEDRDNYNHLQSATKSVTSLAFGLARDQGAFGDTLKETIDQTLDRTIEKMFPDKVEGLDPRKRAITLHNLFGMSSGLNFDNDVFSVEMWVDRPADPIRYILDKPLYANPGERFYYRDCDPQLIGYAIQRAVGHTEEELVRERIFGPLGITHYYWDHGVDGVSMAAHGLHLRPRDFAKIGWLALEQGTWKGQRIISQEWMAQATSKQTTSATPDRNGALYPYGLFWWIVPDVGFSTWGHGGQFTLAVPSKRMLLVQVAYPDADMHGSMLNDFLDLVQPLLDQ